MEDAVTVKQECDRFAETPSGRAGSLKTISKTVRFAVKLFAVTLCCVVILFSGSSGQSLAAASKPTQKASREIESILSGKRSWKEWKSQTDWDSYAAESYKPSKKKVSAISRIVRARNIRFILFAGSWCKDSEAQLPTVMKLLDAARIASRNIDLYGVDGQMKEPSGQSERFGILNVPTLIILKGERELGRIVERPMQTWEDDILSILSNENEPESASPPR